ncbi:hypothetical protein [Kiloniella sp.]|uniref:hypothetical protein n=1 Tax=Kiloniella sp. TaxID=1938587 RepID=UPI003A8DB77B
MGTKKSIWKTEHFWNRLLNWQMVRGFGQSAPATLTMATPFIGYAILYHAEIEIWLGSLGGLLDKGNLLNDCDQLISFPMRLNLLYCGILLLGIGTIVYRLFAPVEIKTTRSIADYVMANIDLVTARNLRSMFITIKSRRPDAVDSLLRRAPWLERDKSLKTASDALKQDEDNQIRIDVLRSYYSALDRNTGRTAVKIVTVFFVLGFILLSIPGVAFTARVMCTISYDLGSGFSEQQ